jgi:uncharacterized protein (DUF1800 family)
MKLPTMRMAVFLLLAVCSAASWSLDSPLGPERARKLLTRAGFAPSEVEVRAIAGLTHVMAVERLLADTQTRAGTSPPTWIDEAIVSPRAYRAMNEEQRQAERARQIRMGLELRGWWLREMATTASPLTERMTLFWHNHFVSAQPKVRYAQLMYRQNVLLREHALGRFDTLLHAVAKDPAMLIYLDSATSRQGAPNENFAREVMELFTLGEGAYSERDIKEAARAFTGWSMDPDQGSFVFRRGLHDHGVKTVFGRSGAFDGDAVLDILLAQPAAAEFIVAKLWREFVSQQPDSVRVIAIAAQFRSGGWRIDRVVRALLLQSEVIEHRDDTAMIKAPVEVMVGLVRQSGGSIAVPAAAAVAVAGMGQNLFSAPNVRGWPGGEAWINTQTLLARKQFIERALGGAPVLDEAMMASTGNENPLRRRLRALEQMPAVTIDPVAWLKGIGFTAERPLPASEQERLAELVLAVPPMASTPATTDSSALGFDVLRSTLLDPLYQLK